MPTTVKSETVVALDAAAAFEVVTQAFALQPSDRLLEVGCGGGALLSAALQSGCTAAAVDHSPAMVRLACELNADAITAGRLEIVRARRRGAPVR